jgi:hypothetical protein
MIEPFVEETEEGKPKNSEWENGLIQERRKSGR